jgi:hypothetical protein
MRPDGKNRQNVRASREMNTPHYYGSIGVMNARHLYRRGRIVRRVTRSLRAMGRQVFGWLDPNGDDRPGAQAGDTMRVDTIFAPRGDVSHRLDRPLGIG